MDTVISLLLFLLVAVAVAPLLLLALYVLASHFELRIADRLLDWTVGLLKLQWFGAGGLNIALGVALAALGVWAGLHAATWLQRLVFVVLVPFGLWRVFRGAALLGAMLAARTSGTHAAD